MSAPKPFAYLLLLFQGAIWGSSFLAIKLALEDFGPMTVAAGRIGLAAAMMLVYATLRGNAFPREVKTLMLLAVVGLFNCAIPFFLIPWGEQSLESGQAAILMAIGPLIALVIAHFTTTDERLNRYKAFGFSLGFVGVCFVIGIQPLLNGLGELVPQLAILMAATSYAISGAVAKRIHGVPSAMVTACVLSFASLVTVPLSFLLEAPMAALTHSELQRSFIALIYLGLIPTGLAFLIRFYLIKNVGFTFVSQVGYLVPVFGVLFGVWWLDEQMTLSMVIGLVCILTGLAISRKTRQKSGLLPENAG